MEESEERTEKRPHTNTDTDVESTQSRQKKGQMKSIFLSDSDDKAIVDFVKQHEELYDKIHVQFKDKHRKEGLWQRLAYSRNFICQHCQARSGSRRNISDVLSSHEVRTNCSEEL